MILDGTQERNEQEEFRLQMALAYFDKGLNYWTDSDLASAMREFSRSLEVREDICGRKDRETAKCYLWVGTIYFLQDAWDRALDEFCRCFRIQCEIAEGNPEACHVVTNWINKCLDALGAKDASKKSLYWTKFKTCIEAEQKGDNLKDNEKYKRAIEHFRSALHLEYSRRDLNPTTPGRPLADCADLYYKIGRCYQLAGKVDCAVMEYRHAFSVYVAKFGLNHRHTIFTMEHIAETITEMGFRDSVADEYVDTIHKSLRHEQTGDWMMDVKKDPSNALKEYEAALKIEGKNVGKTQVACGVLYHKIGKACSELKQTKQALIYFCQAVAIFEPTLGPQHDLTVTSLNLVRECVGISQEGSMCTRSRYCGSHPAQKS